MKNTLTLAPAHRGCDISIGNPGGGHGMRLSYADLLKLAQWLETWREDGFSAPLRIVQKKEGE